MSPKFLLSKCNAQSAAALWSASLRPCLNYTIHLQSKINEGSRSQFTEINCIPPPLLHSSVPPLLFVNKSWGKWIGFQRARLRWERAVRGRRHRVCYCVAYTFIFLPLCEEAVLFFLCSLHPWQPRSLKARWRDTDKAISGVYKVIIITIIISSMCRGGSGFLFFLTSRLFK